LTVTGRATIGTNLTVSGNTTLGGASKTVTIGGTSSTLTIGGAGHTTNTTGWFGVTGRATVSTNLFVGANTYVMGNMGIGMNSTSRKLDVNGGSRFVQDSAATTGAIILRQNSGDTEGAFIQWVNNGNTLEKGWMTIDTSSNMKFAAGSTERMRIASSGLVTACNSMTVTQNLTVSGNTTINGTTTDKSNALSQTLTDGATITWDTSLGRVATITLGGNRTMAAPTNLKVGTYILHVIQDGTGSRTIAWNAVFKWVGAVAPVLSTTAARRDILSFVSDGTNLYGSFLPDVR
jgi:hypothetical protein